MNTKTIIYICLVFSINACLNIKTDSKDTVTEHTEIDEQVALQLEGLETYMRSTHFTGRIANIKITPKKLPDTSPDDSLTETLHLIHADIIETFIGTVSDKIEFKIITEADETIQFENEVIISLCQSNGELFWAGSGSVFSASHLFIQKATQIKNSQANNSFPSFCE